MDLPDFELDINGLPFRYRENNKLKKKDTVLPFTKAHIDELDKCRKDVKYFTDNHYKIVHQDHGLIQATMRDYQSDALENFEDNRFNICKWPRQSGKSTVFAAYVCWFAIFHSYKNVAILANKASQAKELLARIKLAYQNLPSWLQLGVVKWNEDEIELENGSKVIAASTSADTIRGRSIALLIVDECAFIPPNLWDEFWSSIYPTIASSKTSRVILVSTPKGMNHFYKLWTLAEADINEFVPLSIDWRSVPGYDDEFKKLTIANTSTRHFSQEFECNFLASASSLIDTDCIEAIPHKSPIPLEETLVYRDIVQINETFIKFINIYEQPKVGHTYSIGIDPAKITEESAGDSLAIQVIDITTFPYEQVASVIIPSSIHYLEIPDFVNVFGRYYNEALVFIENNDTVGQEIADILLIDYEYDNIYGEPLKPGISGFRTTKKNKKIGCLNLKMLVERNQLRINDFDTISQLSTFIKRNNSYRAEDGYQDDAVMALVATLIFMQDRQFFEDRMLLVTEMTSRGPGIERTEEKLKEDPMADGHFMDFDDFKEQEAQQELQSFLRKR